MKPFDPNRTLLFAHIPKTAGSTLHEILDREYQSVFTLNGLNPQESIEQFNEMSEEQVAKFDLVKGHLALQLKSRLNNPVLLTFLRDPVDRVISDFFYVKRAPWNRHYEAVVKLQGLDEYLDFMIEHGMDNVQTRHLANSIENQPDSSSEKMYEEGERLLASAIENLNTFDLVFDQKQFDEALVVMKKLLSWNQNPYYQIRNKTSDRPTRAEIPVSTLDRIIEVERFDLKLHQRSIEINQKLMESLNIEKELDQFRRKNRFYQRMHRSLPMKIWKKITL